jgi:hypothetical protein
MLLLCTLNPCKQTVTASNNTTFSTHFINIIVLFVETPRKFITAKLSIRKPGSSSVLIICDLFNSHALFIYKSVVICWLASFEI